MLNKIVVGIDPSKKKYRAAVSDRDDIQIANVFILLGITSMLKQLTPFHTAIFSSSKSP